MPPKHSAKVPLSDIAKIEQLIAQEPAREPSEVSKRQAIAMLAPKLYEMRRKGYTWRNVAEWLSGHGLTMTAAALQRHLRGVKGSTVRASSRGRSEGRGDGKAAPSRTLVASTPEAAVPTAPPPLAAQPVGPPPGPPNVRDLDPPKGASNVTIRPDRRII